MYFPVHTHIQPAFPSVVGGEIPWIMQLARSSSPISSGERGSKATALKSSTGRARMIGKARAARRVWRCFMVVFG